MWLLDTEKIQLRYFSSPTDVPSGYAILSHVWGKDEQTFQETPYVRPHGLNIVLTWMRDRTFRRPSQKIKEACARACHDGFRWLWADTTCIDKTNSSELSEAINSMYEWYRQAAMCYALLDDVPSGEVSSAPQSAFRRSRWFKRSWTLQELIAPHSIIFLSQDWQRIGAKRSLAPLIEEVTGIDQRVLTHTRALSDVSVACRMSWAAGRQATRVEDQAYSLMGIFGVYMPTIYGEGKHAFTRLQEEIIKKSPDQSIFAWGRILDDYHSGTFVESAKEHDYERQINVETLLASSPADFSDCADISPISHREFAERLGIRETVPEYTKTVFGVRTTFPLLDVAHTSSIDASLGLLACQDSRGQLIALYFRCHPQMSTTLRYYVGGYIAQGGRRNHYYRAARLPFSSHVDILTTRYRSSSGKLARIVVQPSPTEVHIHAHADGLTRATSVRSNVTARSTLSMIFFEPPCTIVLSRQSLDGLKAMQFIVPMIPKDGFRLQTPGDYQSITFLGTESFTVHLGVCPLDRSSSTQIAQLWATVRFDTDVAFPLTGSDRATIRADGRETMTTMTARDIVLEETMLVQAWKNARATFGSRGKQVRLMFSYPCSAPGAENGTAEVYELDIRFEGHYRRARRAGTVMSM